ncbi:MAG: PEP-CTERM sorting domain-containing protein [Acidobacteria bacterium]|nr:PEP-CTERM sorting domain-containing protein [Acidobacteriota bacterium]
MSISRKSFGGHSQNAFHFTEFSVCASEGGTSAQVSNATIIGYQSEVNSNAGVIVFKNISALQTIERIEVYLGAGTRFFTPPVPFSTSPGNPITIAHFAGFTATNTDAEVGLSNGPVSSIIVNGPQSATFLFTGFDPGEAWGVFVDLFNLAGTAEAGGSDFDGITLQIYFSGVPTPLTSSCTDPAYTVGVDECFPATFTGNKKSFPSSMSDDVVAGVPEPSTLGFIGGALVLMAMRRRHS